MIGCINPHGMYPFPKDRESCPDCRAIRADIQHRRLGYANRPVGPWGIFRTGPHRSVRQVLLDYWWIILDMKDASAVVLRRGLPYGWWKSPFTWAGLIAWMMLTALITTLVVLYLM